MSWYSDMEPFETGYIDAGIQATQEAADFYDNNRFANLALRWDGANGRALLGLEWERFGQDAVDDAGAPVDKRDDT